MDELMIDMIEEPEFAHALLGKIADYNVAHVTEALKYDIDAVIFGDDWGQQNGLIVGYDRWKEFIYPYIKRMYSLVREAGKSQFVHSCGDVDELFDDLMGLGLNYFNPFQPEAMSIIDLPERYRDRLTFFWGGTLHPANPSLQRCRCRSRRIRTPHCHGTQGRLHIFSSPRGRGGCFS